ncbi:MAG: excinuclease ABC subunit A, partial [Bacteroidales bacterium]|nr:excinuclease ABC subunit A [Bacteroidales bacterium]
MSEDRNSKNSIIIRGARVNNLKNISLNIPRNKLVVLTGLSGSGKSSLAFDTIYAEGQRRYVESLSSYARQFLGRINKPDVDFIEGIPPAIAIEQKVNTRNPRSTVGTSTEIYDYIKLLYARAGVTYSPVSDEVVKRDSVTDVVDYILSFEEGTSLLILSPVAHKLDSNFIAYLELMLSQGTTRMEYNGEILKLEDILANKAKLDTNVEVNIIIDRIRTAKDEDSVSRFADSVQTAYAEGNGACIIKTIDAQPQVNKYFSNRFERDGMEFEEPNEHMFSFNSPYGACPRCEGYGRVIGIDEDLVIPDKSLSIYDSAVACWRGEGMKVWKDNFVMTAPKYNFPIHKPVYDLSDEQYRFLWEGNARVEGLDAFFKYLEDNKYKVQYRVMLSRYSGKTTCPECRGARLRKDATYVKISGRTLPELVLVPIDELYQFFKNIDLSEHQKNVAGRILVEIENRLDYMMNVGLGYLTLNRLSATLSGGESQRINLATSLGSSLVGSLYILDEPSIGLHPRDTTLLIEVLRKLQKIGNTVIVVEHDEEIIRAAHEIVDIGPLAGRHGGEIVFQGSGSDLEQTGRSLTADYLTGRLKIILPKIRRKSSHFLEVTGARENNLKKISVKFPLHL